MKHNTTLAITATSHRAAETDPDETAPAMAGILLEPRSKASHLR
jgi:hypothetical protein